MRTDARWLPFALAALLAVPAAATAQTISAPDPHWGGYAIPPLEPGAELGLSLDQFTELDKARFPDDPSGDPVRYNDIDQTHGLNFLHLGRTRMLRRFARAQSNLYFRSSLQLGWVGDAVTEYYQNDIIHEVRDLDPVPRDGRSSHPLVAYGGELNFNFFEVTRDREGATRMRPTPFFVGGGFHAGTMLQDVYAHFGFTSHRFPQDPSTLRGWARWGVGSVVRTGVLAPGVTFDETARSYAMAQVALEMVIAPYKFPVALQYIETIHSGAFLAPAEFDVAGPYGDLGPRRDAIDEHFSSFRLQIGAFTFETYNDSRGGKDRGPTYGARMFVHMRPGEDMYRWIFTSPLWGWL